MGHRLVASAGIVGIALLRRLANCAGNHTPSALFIPAVAGHSMCLYLLFHFLHFALQVSRALPFLSLVSSPTAPGMLKCTRQIKDYGTQLLLLRNSRREAAWQMEARAQNGRETSGVS